MKKHVCIATLIFLIVVVGVSYFPLHMLSENVAEKVVSKESKETKERLRNYKDSLLRAVIKDRTTNRYTCVLYHNCVPSYRFIDSKRKDYLKSWIIKGVNFDNILFEFYPNFGMGENKLTINWLCHEITEWNLAKGHNKYEPVNNKEAISWYQSGWAFGCVSRGMDSDSYECYLVHPYIVDFLKNTNNVNFDMLNEILNASYDFFVGNERSDFYNCSQDIENFQKLNYWNAEGHDYWYWGSEGAYDRAITKDFEPRHFYGQFCVGNNFNVYLGISNVTQYKLMYDSKYTERKKEEYISKFGLYVNVAISVIEVLLLLSLIIHLFRRNKTNQDISVSLLKRVVELSNPKRYLKSHLYDKQKVEMANGIFDRAIKTDKNDKETIFSLCKEVEDKFGVSLISHSEIKKLREKCNPKQFMKPYDAEKVSIANELYSRLNSNQISCGEYLEISSQIDKMMSNDSKAVEVASSETEVLAEEIQAPENENVEECTTDNDNHLEKPHKKKFSIALYVLFAILFLFASLFAIPKSQLGLTIFLVLLAWVIFIGRYLHRKNKEQNV